MNRYNNHQVHSTTGDISSLRFQQALEGKKSLFREFVVLPPFQSSKDIFCLRVQRIVNPYRKISFNNLEFRVEGVPIRGTVQLRIVPDRVSGMAEIRFWYENRLVGIQKLNNALERALSKSRYIISFILSSYSTQCRNFNKIRGFLSRKFAHEKYVVLAKQVLFPESDCSKIYFIALKLLTKKPVS